MRTKSMYKKGSAVMSVSLSPKEISEIKAAAEQERISRSAYIRRAHASYQNRQAWQNIQAYGRKVAARLGIETDDDVERIAG